MRQKNAFLLFMMIFCVKALANSTGGEIKVVAGNVIAAWLSQDNLGNSIIKGATGTVSSAPNTWTVSDLSTGFVASQISNPILFSNSIGDVVVLWQYSDMTGNFYIAGSILPFGAGTWNSATISESTENTGFFDQIASIDEIGNVMVTWSSYNSTLDEVAVRCSFSTIGTNSTWSTPVTISN